MFVINPRFRWRHLLLILCLCYIPDFVQAADQYAVIYNKPASPGRGYMQDLLKLALNYSGKPYTYITTEETYSRPRQMESVKNGSLSLMWGGTSEQMESDYITVEKKLVLVYPLPTYFFVHTGNPELAADIEAGLEAAITDGSFDRYFYSSKEVRDVIQIADLPNRRAIHITNPFLPEATPLHRKELWLSIEDLKAGASKTDAQDSGADD